MPLRPRAALAVTALLALLAAPVRSASPYLVLDLETTPNSADRAIFLWQELAGRVLFAAGESQGPLDLWATDGTELGTRRLSHLGPSSSIGDFLYGTPDLAFFRAGAAIWRSDGTTEGTFPLTPTNTLFNGSCFGQPIASAFDAETGLLYYSVFTTDGPLSVGSIWVSDGTLAGTRVLVDNGPVSGCAHQPLAVSGGKVFFPADLGTNGWELWVADGLTGALTLLTELVPGDNITRPVAYLTPLGNGRVIFLGGTAEHGGEPWVSDGTPGGTRLLKDLVPGGGSSFDGVLAPGFIATSVGAFFIALDADRGHELWRTDGTSKGTIRLTSFTLDQPFGNTPPVAFVLEAGGRVYFRADDGQHGSELWTTDGSVRGTKLLADLCPGPCSGGPSFRSTGERLFFSAKTPEHGFELWTTNGSPETTWLIHDVCPGSCDGRPSEVFRLADQWVFSAKSQANTSGRELWSTTGAPGGGRRLSQPGSPVRVDEYLFFPVARGDELLFVGSTGATEQLWKTALQQGSAELVSELGADHQNGSSNPAELRGLGPQLFFVGPDHDSASSRARALWRSDGSVSGTTVVARAEQVVQRIEGLRVLNNRLLFHDPNSDCQCSYLRSYDPASGESPVIARTLGEPLVVADRAYVVDTHGDLLVTDGTPGGTHELLAAADLPIVGFGSINSLGDTLYFLDRAQREFWRTDGTLEGTDLLLQLPPGAGVPGQLLRTGSLLYFLTDLGGSSDAHLWVSNGTTEGTYDVAILAPSDLRPTHVSKVFPTANQLFFNARSGAGHSLWVTGGTAANTRPVAGFAINDEVSTAALGDRLLFPHRDAAHGWEVWITDGTLDGTHLLKDIFRGEANSLPHGFQPSGDKVYFSANDGASGFELWVTDGTPEGTHMAADVQPGPESSDPSGMTRVGDLLYFAADDPDVGRELWALPLVDPADGPCNERPDSLCLLGERFRVQARWRIRATGEEGWAGAQPFSEESGFFWFFSPDNVELVAKVLDGTGLNGFYWTFYGALSDVEYWVEVTDLVTGQSRTYHNPSGEICGVGDAASIPETPVFPLSQSRKGGGQGQHFPASTLSPKATTGSCAPDGTTLCLLGGRFAVSVDWSSQHTGATGVGHALTGTDQSGYFWFFSDGVLELVVKTLDATAVNGHFWVFYGSLSDVEFTLRVTDTQTGSERRYHNPPGNLCGGADTEAFP